MWRRGRAQANVNCRILPGHSLEEIRRTLEQIVADPKITVRFVENNGEVLDHGSNRGSYEPPPLRADVFGPLEKVVAQMWPAFLSSPTWRPVRRMERTPQACPLMASAVWRWKGTTSDAHGKDERVLVESFYGGVDFYNRFLKAVTSN